MESKGKIKLLFKMALLIALTIYIDITIFKDIQDNRIVQSGTEYPDNFEIATDVLVSKDSSLVQYFQPQFSGMKEIKIRISYANSDLIKEHPPTLKLVIRDESGTILQSDEVVITNDTNWNYHSLNVEDLLREDREFSLGMYQMDGVVDESGAFPISCEPFIVASSASSETGECFYNGVAVDYQMDLIYYYETLDLISFLILVFGNLLLGVFILYFFKLFVKGNLEKLQQINENGRMFFVSYIIFALSTSWLADGILENHIIFLLVIVFWGLMLFSISRLQPRKYIKKIGHDNFIEIQLAFCSILNCAAILILGGTKVSDLTFISYMGNLIPIYILLRIFYMLFNDLVIAQILNVSLFAVFGVANYYVVQYRGTPIYPWDLFGVATLGTVVGEYTLVSSYRIIIALLLMLSTLIIFYGFSRHKLQRNNKSLVVSISVIIFLGLMYYRSVFPNLVFNSWDPISTYQVQGDVASFIKAMNYLSIKKPSGYSESAYNSLIDTIEVNQINETQQSAVNIIVVMNESFADLSVIGNDNVQELNDMMPFIDSLSENTIKGNLYVSALGGGTSNSEFEVLTGCSKTFVPGIPYVTSIRQNTNNLASYLNDLGYSTTAMHPYERDNWNRVKVYNYFGFDNYISLDTIIEDGKAFSDDLRSWNLLTDESDYHIIEEYESEEAGKYFMFNVTIQNHGGYESDYIKLEHRTDLSEYGEFDAVEQYVDLVKTSDEAFEQMVNYYKDEDTPTIICFFGDHQPGLEDEFYDILYGKDTSELLKEEKLEKYITPFVIWANYDIDEQYIDKMSANYLGAFLLKAANLPMNEYWSFLLELFHEYPVICSAGVLDTEGHYYKSVDSIEDSSMMEYKYLQYHVMTGQ
ncbi:MAG: LTA synthase family protein [Lachnospiraceae bacterium]